MHSWYDIVPHIFSLPRFGHVWPPIPRKAVPNETRRAFKFALAICLLYINQPRLLLEPHKLISIALPVR
jgi:hypothetical protein